jgi:nucleotide-binding universal stress UspA family protein
MELNRVLVGVDFSDASLAVVRWVAQHLVPAGELVLVHALDIPQLPAFLRLVLPPAEDVETELRAAAQRRMAELISSLDRPGLSSQVRAGSPAHVLADAARECGADLLVVGEHGRRRGVRGLLGTTAERLLNVAPVPVLIARELPNGPPTSVLAPLDASDIDAHVLQWARLLQERFGARVTACHAVDLMELYSRVRTISAAARMKELESQVRADALGWVRLRLDEAGFPEDESNAEVRMGDPRYTIPAMADAAGADLVVMGGRGAGAVSRAVVGSVTSAILSSTSFAVLVVLGDDAAG